MGAILRGGLGLPAAMLAFAGVPLFAEERDPEIAPERAVELRPSQVDYMVVTGTRILRRDFDSASPIVTVMPEFFESVGAPTVEAALNRYPQLVSGFSSTSNDSPAGGRALLDLRGLGPQYTLVLLDGRRLTPGDGRGGVDVNIIPPTLIDRVEIVSGGASAVYGSDAVAGVVNFRLVPSFEGIQLGGFYAQTDRNDGEQWDLNLTAGTTFAGGRGSIYGFIGRSERKLVTQGDRSFSQYTLRYVGPGNGNLGPGDSFVAGGSDFIEEGAVFLPTGGPNPISRTAFDSLFERYGFAPGSVPFQPAFGVNDDGTVYTQGTFEPGSVANFRGERDPNLPNDRAILYNFAPANALQLPLERNSAFMRTQFDVSASTSLYADVLWADYEVMQRFAPTPLVFVFMPPTNPFIPNDLKVLLDSRPDPDARLDWDKRMSEVGPRVSRHEYGFRQGTVGLEGQFLERWRFDAYAQWGEMRADRHQDGNVLRSKVEELTFAPDGGLELCGGFNIFGIGSISEGCAAYVAARATSKGRTQQKLAEVSVFGPLIALPDGELRAAFGVIHKRDEHSFTADPLASAILPDGRTDLWGYSAADDVDAKIHNTDMYVELLVPLLADRPGAESLEAGLGYRRSHYDTSGGVDAFKAELLYRPVDVLRLRASYQNAVRSPSIFELYQPQLPTQAFLFLTGGDPCRANSPERTGPDAAAVEELCLAQGVPADLLEGFQPRTQFAFGFQGGNPDLDPEKASTWTLGAAWSPGELHPTRGRLQASIDWYRIKIDDAIDWVLIPQVVANCFDAGINPDFAADQPWCTFFSRDAASGEIVDAYEILRNLARIETSGIDVQLDWRRDLGPGSLGANLLVSWVDYFKRGAGAGAPVEDLVGISTGYAPGGTLPKWKGLLTLSYDWGNSSLAARTRYIGQTDSLDVPEFGISSRTYLDLYASYDFDARRAEGLRLGFGIENVTDRDPPLVPFGPANTDPQQFDVLGRRYFVTLSYRF